MDLFLPAIHSVMLTDPKHLKERVLNSHVLIGYRVVLVVSADV